MTQEKVPPLSLPTVPDRRVVNRMSSFFGQGREHRQRCGGRAPLLDSPLCQG